MIDRGTEQKADTDEYPARSGAFIRPPDPHRCFSDLPTAPQGPSKGPKPKRTDPQGFH